VQQIISGLPSQYNVGAVWMTEEYSNEERLEQADVAAVCSNNKLSFKLWPDEKYFIDE
jgi:deoxyribodipyrimidine photo-lyase